MHIENINIIIDATEVLELEEEIIEQILSLYTIHCFEGDTKQYFESIDNEYLTEKLEQAKTEIEKISSEAKQPLTKTFSQIISSLN